MSLTYRKVSCIFSILDVAQKSDLEIVTDEISLKVKSRPTQSHEDRFVSNTDQKSNVSESDNIIIRDIPLEIKAQTLGFVKFISSLNIGSFIKKDQIIAELYQSDDQVSFVNSPYNGYVLDICASDNDFIEYNQTLLIIQEKKDVAN